MRNEKRQRRKGLEQHRKIECAAVLKRTAACLHIFLSASPQVAAPQSAAR